MQNLNLPTVHAKYSAYLSLPSHLPPQYPSVHEQELKAELSVLHFARNLKFCARCRALSLEPALLKSRSPEAFRGP